MSTQYDPDWVRAFYDAYGEKEWARWDESPVERIKLEVHCHYLRKYLPSGARVLDIGAGAGRFTQVLAGLGARVVVADISPGQLALNRENAACLGFASAVERWVACDMCELEPEFAEEEFDAVVCYGGPLSYVFDRRGQALRQLLRVTRPGGLLFLGVMSLWGAVHHFLPGVLRVDPEKNRVIIATGDLDRGLNVSGHYCHMFRAAEFRSFLQQAGVVIEVLSASDCLAATWAEYLETQSASPEVWQHLLAMELEACCEPGCLDMGTHLIGVVRKRQSEA